MNKIRLIVLTLPLLFVAACEQQPEESSAEEISEVSMIFNEPHRPQYHFSPPEQWMNDPNGMVYYDGEYHLFYQHYPDDNVWGPMHWGHAVSRDLVTWEHLPIALYPDENGYIFSGSAVIDRENTSGLGSGDTPPLIAIYTYHDPVGAEDETRTDFQSQGIAYSLDKGRSWTAYEGNPVLMSPGIRDFRDPKVMWYEPDQKWIMTLAVKDHISFYSSPDLKTWTHESDFGKTVGAHGGVWECPDLFALPVDDTDEVKWVLLVSINPGGPAGGSATQYFVGEFDGKTFTMDPTFASEVTLSSDHERALWIDYGADNYAGVTWSGIPDSDGRRLFLGWMSNWEYAQTVPTTIWRSAMTLPRELTLSKRAGSYRVHSRPTSEVKTLIEESVDITGQLAEGLALSDSLFMLELTGDDLANLNVTLSNDGGETVRISVDADALIFDRTASGIIDFSDAFPAIHEAPLEGLQVEKIQIFVDLSSIEIFVNDGAVVMTELIFPTRPYMMVEGSGSVDAASWHSMKRIWDTGA